MTSAPGLEQRTATLRAQLAQRLAEAGELPDPAWRAAFERVPRHVFVPYFYAPGGDRIAHDVPEQREQWLAQVYDDKALVTHRTRGVATSSSSQPSLMASMLHALDVTDTTTMLEVGTGTGYNAALLAHRLGNDRVTTVDVLPELTEAASARLSTAGYRPRVVTGDGALGHPEGGPYDRIIATCRVGSVPSAWLEQLAGDGLLVAPVGTGLARVRKTGTGKAQGRFIGPAWFMPLRAGDGCGTPHGNLAALDDAEPRVGRLPASALADVRFRFLASLVEPGLTWQYPSTDARGVPTSARCWAADGSIAGIDEDGRVTQAGPRGLWTALEEAHDLYERAGAPEHDRYGLVLTPSEQRVWLDAPEGPSWPLPTG
ncbi:methyltransferase domain-containing protein [Streptomyces sp. JJ38]|uniref:methyltransferase domain-containing protein n=1 Tax=Streptomyces sp. JJ38 TaxID=2738128 RepID=UPI001C59A7A0|nr:methyltransferase domain-containing protein [Streptomyces sp. JJ38]MBW1596592.1 methyltransferase domain-containing protein [Streptomyces sp. JJ38]